MDAIWRADPPPSFGTGPRPLHRFAEFFRDIPILDHGQSLYLTDEQCDRAGRHVEACGLRKAAPRQIKRWPPPRGNHQPGNTGFWVPVDTPDPPEVTTPNPASMTAEEREFLRLELEKYYDTDHPGEEST